MMSLTFGLFTQVSDSGPQGPLVLEKFYSDLGPLSNNWFAFLILIIIAPIFIFFFLTEY